ncbi:MAG: ErfK/YbiS/YcfS/YnhG family protein, partial [Chloroflexi bacterium]|nr:ErfK/YbiS/YcfS/YnhG family protein [Chloroflexota bacterium]
MQAAYADRMAPGVHALGIDLGGRTKDEATTLVAGTVAELLRQPVLLKADGHDWLMTAFEVGMRLDPEVVVNEAFAVGHEGNPLHRALTLWTTIFLGEKARPSPIWFEPALIDGAVNSVAASIERPVRDASIATVRVADAISVAVTPEQVGARVDRAASAQRIREAVS